MTERSKRLIIVSGLSGSGKTLALHALEDDGYYSIDNLPVDFLDEFARLVMSSDLPIYKQVAVGIDARNPAEALSEFPGIIEQLRETRLELELIFIEAHEDVLIKRFSETRRRHPLSSDAVPLAEALGDERRLLGEIAEQADLRIDTTYLHVHALRDLIRKRVARESRADLSLQVLSFGFKHGVPPDADFVFDVRCLPNPHWQSGLRDLTGRDLAVIEFLEESPMVEELAGDIVQFLKNWIPKFYDDNRSYLTVAIGCTGGRHRSVYCAIRVATEIAGTQRAVIVNHRDI
jgi:UPF0042 nucleotide-binding protein